MYKRHRIKLIVLLMLIAGLQNVHPQQQIALDTYAIFERSCFNCHGPDGAYKETLLMEHNALITENGPVVPGNPEASRLYKRLLGEGGQLMPLGGPPLPDSQIETVTNWILAGAPDWAAAPTTDSDFISPAEILNTIEAHLMSLTPFDRAYARYFTMTHLYNAGESVGKLQEYRKGLSKLVNSLSWRVTVTNPQPIDLQETIFYIDLRHYEWDVNDSWTKIEAEYPYHISFDAPAQTALKEQLTRLQGEVRADIPSIHVDWFVGQASLPPLYHDLLSLPLTDRELEERLEVDVVRNITNAPGVDVWRAGTNNSGVSNNNRVIERHTSRYGAYWKSYDFAGSVGTQNIFTHPLDFTHDGGEVIFNLPNGLQAYYVTNASGFRLDEAPINIVSNPAASDPTVRNGLSCFGCHTEGMKTFEDEVRSVIESNATPAYNKAHALRLYVEQSKMDALLQGDMDTYKEALAETGGAVDDIEPISRFHEVFQEPVDAAYAAAVVGLETEVFQEKIRENVGLQNLGLLVLDSANGSMKRDAWTEGFDDVIFALDFPESQVDSPSQPDLLPGGGVHIPDSNLRAAIAEALGKSPNAPITVEEMERLRDLDARNRGIQDLTGLQFATNATLLKLANNEISDLSPIAGLINVRDLRLNNNRISDISPYKGLRNLTSTSFRDNMVSDLSPIAELINLDYLTFSGNNISDLSPIAGLINLRTIDFSDNNVSDLSPLRGLINLESLGFSQSDNVSNISPVAGLVNLKRISSWGHSISDLSPLAGLTKLEIINFCGGNISDLTPLVGLTGLKELYLAGEEVSNISPIVGLTGLTRLGLENNDISDVSPLAGLTNLKWLRLDNNDISDVSPIANLTNLTWLAVDRNNISDLSPLEELRKKIKVFWSGNPGIPKDGGPNIEGPWLWVLLPDTGLKHGVDVLSDVSGGTVTELAVATNGATVGKLVGDEVWVSDKLPSGVQNNIGDMLQLPASPFSGVIYGTVFLYSPREQETTLHVGADDGLRVWLNGTLVYNNFQIFGSGGYTDFAPVTLRAGKNILLVAVELGGRIHNGEFGFKLGTEYTVATTGVGYTFSRTPIHTGDTFTLNIHAENVIDFAGWQFDIAFDPAALEAIDVNEGDFLKMDGGTTFFQGGSIDNAAGKITQLSAARLSSQGVTGTGTLLQVTFKAKSVGETELSLQNFEFAAITGQHISAGPQQIHITVEEQLATGDVNRDGRISILDLVLIAQQLGNRVPANSPVDLNRDGVVSILDIVLVARKIGSTIAPAAPVALNPDLIGAIEAERLDPATVEAWIAQARLEDDGSLAFKQGIENLQNLLASLIPEETALLANYPNPFNPETWIPYQLSEPTEVMLTIYDMNGQVIRRLVVGHQAAGMYQSRSRAAYWDGRNQLGEFVASGLYFYTLTAGDFTATRRMLILK
ncbi:hypothetical protein C6502_14770 [Candidatus Poribacteria bacterium]|nr:MAG: hypothetical protein C6502_14770 [Candidatus Poribacteria bacterium]